MSFELVGKVINLTTYYYQEKTMATVVERFNFTPNLSTPNRQLRFIVGALMIVAPMLSPAETLGNWSILMLAAIPVITTAIIGWDPLYDFMNKTSYVEREIEIQQRSWSYANVGIIDRSIRLSIGMVLLYSLLTMDVMNMDMALTLMAIPLITTALVAWDPLYAALDINSFGSRTDVKAAEPELEERTLEIYFSFKEEPTEEKLAKAA